MYTVHVHGTRTRYTYTQQGAMNMHRSAASERSVQLVQWAACDWHRALDSTQAIAPDPFPGPWRMPRSKAFAGIDPIDADQLNLFAPAMPPASSASAPASHKPWP